MSPKHKAMIKALQECAFAVESVAHLQGREKLLLPFADAARDAIAEVRALAQAAGKPKPATAGGWRHTVRLSASENHRGFQVWAADGSLIAEVMPRDEDGKEGKANAQQIAAAPQLLAALQEALPFVNNGTHPDDARDLTTVTGRACAAIAAAKGVRQ